MNITHKIYMTLDRREVVQPIDAVQGDRYSRKLALYLQANDSTWQIPEDATVLVRYKKRDGTGGEYDTLPDGTKAWEIDTDKGIVTVALAPQMFTCAGDVKISVALLQGSAEINTFVIPMNVQANPGADIEVSEDYNNNAALAARVANLETDVAALNVDVDELQEDVADLQYVPITISGFSNNVGTVELGTVVDEVTFTWKLNKEPVEQTLAGTQVSVADRSATLTGLALSAAKTFTLSVTDERDAVASAYSSIHFINGVYYGVIDQAAALTSATVLSLTRKLQSYRDLTFSVDAGAGELIAYAFPSRYGTPTFKVGGFEGGFHLAATIEFTNASGYTENYDIWVSEQSGLGSTTVEVS